MDKFSFNPTRGFEDAASFPDPTTEAETRKQLMTPSNQLADYLNQVVVPAVVAITGATGDEEAINEIINALTDGQITITENTVFNVNGVKFSMSVTESES